MRMDKTTLYINRDDFMENSGVVTYEIQKAKTVWVIVEGDHYMECTKGPDKGQRKERIEAPEYFL